jgi:uncharacterized protein (TIGR03435 family)
LRNRRLAAQKRLRREPTRWAVVGTVGITGILFVSLVFVPQVLAQSSAADWEKATGGKMSFGVASVKQNKSGPPPYGDRQRASLPLDPGDSYSSNGGLFSATNFPLSVYIGFAYKLTLYQTQSMQAELPKWANEERFDIQAREPANTTKDQMRMMMQSLLAVRFKLTVHEEIRRIPILALVLVKPGKTGPQLRPHSDDQPCTYVLPNSAQTPPAKAGDICGTVAGTLVSGRMHAIARNISVGQVAGYLPVMGKLDRVVLDQTGLSGNFDFTMEFVPEFDGPPPLNFQPDPLGPTFFTGHPRSTRPKTGFENGSRGVSRHRPYRATVGKLATSRTVNLKSPI